jgi:hypothetical protein
MDPITFAAGAATVLSAGQLIPQLLRAKALSSVVGLSVAWTVVGACLNLGWLGYRWSEGIWLGLISPSVALVLYVMLFAMIAGHRHHNVIAIAVTAIAFASVMVSAVLSGWVAVGAMLAAGSVVHLWPSLWAAYRSAEPDAISATTWAVGLTQATLWGIYGWGTGDSVHLIYGLATAPTTLAILIRVAYVRIRSRRRITKGLEPAVAAA